MVSQISSSNVSDFKLTSAFMYVIMTFDIIIFMVDVLKCYIVGVN